MTDPLELLQRLRVAVMTRQLPDTVALWLQHGVDNYMTGGGTLDHCLGLKAAPGKPNPPAQIRLAQRDDLVRRLARGLEGSLWNQAAMLERAVAGECVNAMQAKYLEEAARLGMDIPKSQAQLYRILARRRD